MTLQGFFYPRTTSGASSLLPNPPWYYSGDLLTVEYRTDPERVAAAYTADSVWRNRSEFLTGRDEIVAFLTRKWEREQEYVLRKDLWAFTDDRIGVRFQYEWHDADGQWWRSYGNELWEFDALGYMRRREASINDVAIEESQRRFHGPRAEGDETAPPLQ